jgi:hypothetical protein
MYCSATGESLLLGITLSMTAPLHATCVTASTTASLLSSVDRTALSPRQPISNARFVEVAQAAQSPDLIPSLVRLEADETVVVDQGR